MSESSNELRVRRILDLYGDSLFRLGCSYLSSEADAQEIVQDTILQYLRYQPDFQGDLLKEKGWLMKTAANLSRNRLRFFRNHAAEELEDNVEQPESADLRFVWDAVQSLPVRYREVIHLFYQEGYSTAEIARLLDRREGSVRSDLHRAREKLKQILREDYDFE
ncbi:MAG: RNA polymerase sigma factor [Solobacterium sp.]|nr:RNA polymerase sigma factor [Solobacterium sp.]